MRAPLALAIAASIAFWIANTEPLMKLSALGVANGTTIARSAAALWAEGSRATAIVVAFCAIVAPGAWLALTLAALLAARERYAPRWAAIAVRGASALREWAMPEVMLLGTLVAYVKVSDVADATPAPGLYAVGALVVLMAWLRSSLDLPVPLSRGTWLHLRRVDSAERTSALLLAAAICYVPANLWPVLVTTSIGGPEADTILSGVVRLYQSGSWILAGIVFIASMVIPPGKIAVMAYLVAVAKRGLPARQRVGTRLYRLVQLVGRWSMLDVFAAAFVVGAVQWGPILSERPGPGLPFFAATAVLTMLAAMAFDPRLLRDELGPRLRGDDDDAHGR